MQILSNILFNLILLFPLLLIREYCIGESKNTHIKQLKIVAFYLCIIQMNMIDMGVTLGDYFLFYCIILVPAGIMISLNLAKKNNIDIGLFADKHIIGIKEKRFLVYLTGYIILFVLITLVNMQEDDKVLQINNDIFNEIRVSETPLETLIRNSENPKTLHYDLENLLNISDYEVLYSGNSKKLIRAIAFIEDVEYSYELTYRRTHKRWELDGIYDSKMTYPKGYNFNNNYEDE